MVPSEPLDPMEADFDFFDESNADESSDFSAVEVQCRAVQRLSLPANALEAMVSQCIVSVNNSLCVFLAFAFTGPCCFHVRARARGDLFFPFPQLERDTNEAVQKFSSAKSKESGKAYTVYSQLLAKGWDAELVYPNVTAAMSESTVLEPPQPFLVVRDAGMVGESCSSRVIVEPSFKAHFKLGKATSEYMEILQNVPDVVCAGESRFFSLIRFLCERMASTFEELGMDLPPWRRSRSILAKWTLGGGSGKNTPLAVPEAKPSLNDISVADAPRPTKNVQGMHKRLWQTTSSAVAIPNQA